MAAKQGLTAQLSQAGEDAKRAVLSRTAPSSWFSNLNLVCTIKSAPPRSPEILQMLATKSGWLFKRNEQHHWQARYCCVVPHTFLYYFGAGDGLPAPTPKQQEEWNQAIAVGYGNRKQHEKRSSLYIFNNNNTNNNTMNTDTSTAMVPPNDDLDNNPNVTSHQQPAGIIDLECYSHVNRSSENRNILELAGDESVDPDLRHFYFCANTDEDSDDWTDALLHNRHSCLVDEVDAYKQVCDGFACQLQTLHQELDERAKFAEEASDELYRVRSQQEDTRRTCYRMVEERMENSNNNDDATLQNRKVQALRDLEHAKSQDMGIVAALRVLSDYCTFLEEQQQETRKQNQRLASDLQQTGQSDQARVQELQQELDKLRREYSTDQQQFKSQLEAMTSKYQQSQTELQDVQKDLSSTKMEMTMHQSQQRNKFNELQQHKKILKREVIELRQKLEDSNSELNLLRHQQENHKLRAEQERHKSELLERYVEKVESQVKVQQNMMEMMSQNGSVHGGGSIGGPHYASPLSRNQMVYVHHGHDEDGEDVDDDDDDVAERLPQQAPRGGRRSLMDDIDSKSHMSELTEDRTQRQFLEFAMDGSSPRQHYVRHQPRSSPRPPSYIIGENLKRTIQSSASSLPPVRRPPAPARDTASVNSSGRLSVAQRARMEADRQTTPVRARLDQKTQEAVRKQSPVPPPHCGSSPNSGLWRRMENAVLGPRPEDMLSTDDDDSVASSSVRSTRVTDYTDEGEEKKTNDETENLSLQERSKLQRAKQLQFLKEQGLIKNEADVRGGAGSVVGGDNSVTSTNISYPRSAVSFPGAKQGTFQSKSA